MNRRSRSGAAGAAESSIQEALRRTVQQAPLPFAVTRDEDHTLAYANAAFCDLAGVAPGEAHGARVAAVVPATQRQALTALLDRAYRDRVEILDERILTPGGSAGHWQCSVWPVLSDNGRTAGLGLEIRGSSPQDEAIELQRAVAEQMLLGALREHGIADDARDGRRRATFLAEAGRLLAQSLDQTRTLAALTELALPTLGSWCIVDILEEGNPIRRLGIYHPDPEKQKLAGELEATWAPEADDPFGAPAMLRDPRSVAITKGTEAALTASAHGAENLLILRQLGIGSLLTVPLLAKQRLLGAVTFVGAHREIPYSPEDVRLAEELAGQGALALHRAQAHDLALVLRRSAESANEAKTAFLAAMSHELRTPLNAIGGYVDLLDMGSRGPVTEAQHAALARVKANQEHLLRLITEILDFARGSSLVAQAASDVNAHGTLAHAIELIEPLIAQRGLVFDGIAGDRSLVACADPKKVTQILVNLLSNAIKFTEPGGHIGAECAGSSDTVTLRISDTGIGIAQREIEVIFEPFVQLSEGLADRASGVGLGLSISRDLARAMKGDLTVESAEGHGARFTLVLPRAIEQ